MPTKLGQNFLKNKEIVEKILQAADLKSDDLVLEVGPGKGILTEQLAKYAGKVIAVEIDGSLAEILRKKFENAENVEILEKDVLKMSLGNWGSWGNKKVYKVVANLPYYITSPVIRKFLEAENPPSVMILMVQKEVAERIVANPGKMSILAVSVQYYAEPEILFYVGKENFEPVPEVDSAVIKITYNRQITTYNKEETKQFFRIVRAGFSAKRKTLANNLSNGFHIPKKEVEEKLKSTGILPNARAQELSVKDWKKLVEIV